jgi:hypothetical protein
LVLVLSLWCVLRWVLDWTSGRAVGATVAFAVATAAVAAVATAQGCLADGASMSLRCLNGGWLYVPAVLMLAALALRAAYHRSAAGKGLAYGAIGFAGAFAARSLDMQFCGMLPAVLHGCWHIGTAYAAYATLGALITASAYRAQ